jgi:hypothetical protein
MKARLAKCSLAVLLGLSLTPAVVWPSEVGPFRVTGYLRQYTSWNLEDIPETEADDAWDRSMNRWTAFLDASTTTGPLRWTGRFRASYESLTNYEYRLQDSANFLRSLDTDNPGRKSQFTDNYEEVDVRELFFDTDIGNNFSMRIGRQQVVWGETDFFHATDVIHGYDFRWRSFYVPENEDVRKPLILLNGTLQVPQAKGSLQMIVRPALDKDEWIGNSVPTFGGRWSNNLSKGFPLADTEVPGPALGIFGSPVGATFNYHHKDGDTDNAHYGARWTGLLGKNENLDYSLMYYHGQGGFMQDPILTLNPDTFGLEFIYPETNTVGATLSSYIAALDITYRAEVAYSPDRKFSSGATVPLPLQIVKKDAYNFLLGFDTNPRLQKYLGTSSQSLFTVQVFDWYLPGVSRSDAIGNFTGSGNFTKHNVLATAILTLPYMHDTLIGTFVAITDLTDGGAFLIPSLEYQWGPHWRFKLEADITVGGKSITNPSAPDGSLVGGFEHNDQLLLRTTFQF